ncbi:MAG: hypothetical protein K9N10_22700 [Deltaproteobacteria bacterium]|nr:hypothetical protein [Deltaproteobacteria bacterium]
MKLLNFHQIISTCPGIKLFQAQTIGQLLTIFYWAASVFTLSALFLPTDGTCDTETPSLLSGHWQAAETVDEKEKRLRTIDELTGKMSGFQKGMARSRLEERTSPPQNLIIEIDGEDVTIDTGNGRVTLELGGSIVNISGSQGEAQVRAMRQGPELIVMTRSAKGKRRTTYRINENLLTMEVTMTGTRLPGSLKYVVSYFRKQ